MEWFRRQKIGVKLTLGFLAVALFGAFIGVEGTLKTIQINELARLMYWEGAATPLRAARLL